MNIAAAEESERRLIAVVEAIESNDADQINEAIRKWKFWVNTVEQVRKILDNPSRSDV